MKVSIQPLEKVYDVCVSEGNIKDKGVIDHELIHSLIERVEEALKRQRLISGIYEKKSKNFTFTLCDNYSIIRMLIDALLYFDKVHIHNHQCSNAFICIKRPELEFDWDILETIRILRNGAEYEGRKISEEQWNQVKTQLTIYIKSLMQLVKEKIKG